MELFLKTLGAVAFIGFSIYVVLILSFVVRFILQPNRRGESLYSKQFPNKDE